MSEEVPVFDGEVEDGDGSADDNILSKDVDVLQNDDEAVSPVRRSKRLSGKVRKTWVSFYDGEVEDETASSEEDISMTDSDEKNCSTRVRHTATASASRLCKNSLTKKNQCRKDEQSQKQSKSRKNEIYSTVYKLAAAECALNTSNNKAALIFEVHVVKIALWKYNHGLYTRKLLKLGFGRWEVDLLVWVKTEMHEGKLITIQQATEKAKELMTSEMNSLKFPAFVASWAKQFGILLGRHHIDKLATLPSNAKRQRINGSDVADGTENPTSLEDARSLGEVPVSSENAMYYTDEQKLQVVEMARKFGTMQASDMYNIPEEQIVQFLSEMARLRTVDEARKKGTIAAAELYGVPEQQVIQWLSESTQRSVERSGSCVLPFQNGRGPLSDGVERELNKWYSENRRLGISMTKDMVLQHASKLHHDAGFTEFEASEGWYQRWFRQWKSDNSDFMNPLPSSDSTIMQDQDVGSVVTMKAGSSDHSDELGVCVDSISGSNENYICGNHNSLNEMDVGDTSTIAPFASEESVKIEACLENTVESDSGLCSLDVVNEANAAVEPAYQILTHNDALVRENNCHGKDLNGASDPSTSTCLERQTEDAIPQECMNILQHLTNCNNKQSNVEDSPPVIIKLESATEIEKFQDSLDDFDEVLPHEITQKSRRKGEHYLPKFKEKVIKFAETHTFQQTAKHFKVHHATISEWCQTQRTKQMMTNKARNLHPKQVKTADNKFIAWLRKCREKNMEFDTKNVHNKCLNIIEEFGVDHVEKHSRWFLAWCSRWDESQASKSDTAKLPHLYYPPLFKLELAYYAQRHGINATSRMFNVSRKGVRTWMNSKETLVKLSEKGLIRNKGGGGKPLSKDAEVELWNWYSNKRANSIRPKASEIKAKALHFFKAHGFYNNKCSSGWFKRWCARYNVRLRHENDDKIIEWVLTQFDLNRTVTHRDLQDYGLSLLSQEVPGFKASAGWSIRFCKRHPQLLQTLAPVNERLTTRMESNVCKFRLETQNLQLKHGISLACIGNMDEIVLSFSFTPSTSSVSENNRRCTLMRRPGMENCQALIVASFLADGGVLPPLIILKETPANEVVSVGQLILYKEKLTVDKNAMLLWLSQVWLRYVPSPNVLIMDCFEPHLITEVKQQMEHHRVYSAVVPAGCTSKAQPIDVGIKKFLQSSIEESWNTYMKSNPQSNSVSSGLRKQHVPPSNEIITWITDAFENLRQKQEIVRRSFIVTGLVESLDNSHEHLVENPSWISDCNSSAEVSSANDSETD